MATNLDPVLSKRVEANLKQLLANPGDLELVLGQLLDSATDANALAPNAWAVSFEPNGEPGYRLNVGQLEVLVFYGEGVRVNLLGTPPAVPGLKRFLSKTHYKSINGEQWAYVGPVDGFRQFQEDLRANQENFILHAALTKGGQARKGTSFQDTHCPELISYACRVLDRSEEELQRDVPAGKSMRRIRAIELRKIKEEHILRAIEDLNNGAEHAFGESTDFDLIHEGRLYAPKAVFGIAGRYALDRILKPEHFSGGEHSVCFRVLEGEGFKIIRKERAFLLTWNPEQYPQESFESELEALKTGERSTLRWSVGNRKDLPIGSTLFLMRLGKEPKGIVGFAVSQSEVQELPHWDPDKARNGATTNSVECLPTRMQMEPIVPLVELNLRWPDFAWTPQGSGNQIPDEFVRDLLRSCRAASTQKYWWVNHKQTFIQETEGGYIWSPKANSDGAFNQTYLNLTLVQPGDVVFSYANTKIQAVGVVSGTCREATKPTDFGAAGEAWPKTGWKVPIEWEMLSTPIVPKEHIDAIAPLLPAKNAPIKPNGNGNERCYLASISSSLGEFLLDLTRDGEASILQRSEEALREAEADQAEKEIAEAPISDTEKEQLIKARRGQGKFRINVVKHEKACRLTGLTDKRFLVASHVKPWAKCESNKERLDGANGLLLAPHADKLFDGGWITFTVDGQILCASSEVEQVLRQWGIDPAMSVGKFTAKQAGYLAYHREAVFARRQTELKGSKP